MGGGGPGMGGGGPGMGGGGPGMGGGGPGMGGIQPRQFNGFTGRNQGIGQGFVPRGSQGVNRFNVQPFNQQNFGLNRSFQRFNSLTPGYGQSRVRGRQ